jgi:hypothetical protein
MNCGQRFSFLTCLQNSDSSESLSKSLGFTFRMVQSDSRPRYAFCLTFKRGGSVSFVNSPLRAPNAEGTAGLAHWKAVFEEIDDDED